MGGRFGLFVNVCWWVYIATRIYMVNSFQNLLFSFNPVSIQFTLDTNRAPPALTELFADMLPPTLRQLSEIQRHAANTLTMDYYAQVQYLNTIIIVRKQ